MKNHRYKKKSKKKHINRIEGPLFIIWLAINDLYLFTLIKKHRQRNEKGIFNFLLTYLTHEVICKFF